LWRDSQRLALFAWTFYQRLRRFMQIVLSA
jgi:hypothetical protein